MTNRMSGPEQRRLGAAVQQKIDEAVAADRETRLADGMTHTPMVDPYGQPLLRTVIDFRRGVDGVVRTINLNHALPNAAVGQRLAFDHPTLTRCLNGTITKIGHVVFLDGAPLTYIEVEVS